MEVRFTHPRNSDTYLAEVSSQLTAKQAIEALCSANTGPFLPPLQTGEDYKLSIRRNNNIILPSNTLGSAGVVDGDILDVMLGGSGACVIKNR